MQVDTHVNNQYNTCFWALRHAGATPAEAQAALKGTFADAKNELLFSRFGINYSELPAMFRKGSVVVWRQVERVAKVLPDGTAVRRQGREPVVLHEDLIGDAFWTENPAVLADA